MCPGELLLVILGPELPGAGPGVLLRPGPALRVPAVLLGPAMLKESLRKKVYKVENLTGLLTSIRPSSHPLKKSPWCPYPW